MTDSRVNAASIVHAGLASGGIGVVGSCPKHTKITFDAYAGCPKCAEEIHAEVAAHHAASEKRDS